MVIQFISWLSINFFITKGEEVKRHIRILFDQDSTWTYYYITNIKMAVGSSPDLAPFSIIGAVGSTTILLNTTAHGGGNPGAWQSAGYVGPMSSSGQFGWHSSWNNWPNQINNYLDLTIPSSFHGQTVKFAAQFQSDECYYVGYPSGFALDDVEILTY